MHMLWRVSTTTDTATNTKRAHTVFSVLGTASFISSRHSHHHSHHNSGHIGLDYIATKAARSSNLLSVVMVVAADLAAVRDSQVRADDPRAGADSAQPRAVC